MIEEDSSLVDDEVCVPFVRGPSAPLISSGHARTTEAFNWEAYVAASAVCYGTEAYADLRFAQFVRALEGIVEDSNLVDDAAWVPFVRGPSAPLISSGHAREAAVPCPRTCADRGQHVVGSTPMRETPSDDVAPVQCASAPVDYAAAPAYETYAAAPVQYTSAPVTFATAPACVSYAGAPVHCASAPDACLVETVSPTAAPVMVAAVVLDPFLEAVTEDLLRLTELVGSEARRESCRMFSVIGTKRFREAHANCPPDVCDEFPRRLQRFQLALDDASDKFSEPQWMRIEVWALAWAKDWDRRQLRRFDAANEPARSAEVAEAWGLALIESARAWRSSRLGKPQVAGSRATEGSSSAGRGQGAPVAAGD